MAGTFIVSFDCEGNWGIADRQRRIDQGFITKKALVQAYEALTRELARFEISATFAFVMAFILNKDELADWLPRLTSVQVNGEDWMRNFQRAKDVHDFSGWFCPEAFDLVREAGTHEIGCHGFRHIPLGDGEVAQADARYELGSAAELASQKNVRLRTFVFPRNRVGHLGLLAEHGYLGFRNAHPDLSRHGRVGNFLRECCIWETGQKPEDPVQGLVSIPGGYFLNWQHGLRRALPQSISLMRWKSILRDAAENDKVAGLYLHPHNLIDGPGTLETFRGVLRIAAKLRETKGLAIMTQQSYCASLGKLA